MRNKIICICLMLLGYYVSAHSAAVTVTLTVDEMTPAPAALKTAEQNLAIVLSEINRAQKAKEILTTSHLPMDDFSLKSLLRIWAVTPFYCDDRTGKLTDFRFALDAQMSESMERCGSVVDKETQMIILQYVERFRTAYNQKDIATIEQMFSDDALIITGKVTMSRASEMQPATAKVEYTKQDKQQYIRNLKLAFARNKWIDVKFSQIGDNGETGGCGGITRSKIDPTKYGVRLRQEWRSSTYSDEGYLFLLWEFPDGGGNPIIHIRTWQPQWVGGKEQAPDDDISTLGAFDL